MQLVRGFVCRMSFCVGGESLIRNLLLGHKIANEFGKVSKTGYSPFGWGQISQMPQLYHGFGIDFASFYRGLNTYMAPKSEFYWEGADGTTIYASRLGQRPRYNMWYIMQRPVFYGKRDGDNRRVSWGSGRRNIPFCRPARCEYEYQYSHRKYEYHDEYIAEKTEQALSEQDDEWTTPNRFWSNGHDSSIPDMREARLIKDANAVYEGVDVFHSTVYDFEQSVIRDFNKNSPVLKRRNALSVYKRQCKCTVWLDSFCENKGQTEEFLKQNDCLHHMLSLWLFLQLYAERYIRRSLLIKHITICFKIMDMIQSVRVAEMLYIMT